MVGAAGYIGYKKHLTEKAKPFAVDGQGQRDRRRNTEEAKKKKKLEPR